MEYFFPKEVVQDNSEAATDLRKCIVLLEVGHLSSAALAIIFVGFPTFFVQALYFAILYSLYVTLRKWMIFVYIFFVGLNVFQGVFNIWSYEGVSFFMYFLIQTYYCGAIYLIWH